MQITTCQLLLKKFSLEAGIGIHDFERNASQRIFVSVELEINPALNFKADEIGNTVDYDFLRVEIAKLVNGKRYDTQEALCYEILDLVLSRDNVLRAKVLTEKPDVYADSESIGCEMSGARDQ